MRKKPHDKVGNRLTSAQTSGTWSYNTNNELASNSGASCEYDDNGNMTRKKEGSTVTNFVYDIDNRLIRVTNGSGSQIAEYTYDPFGRRL